MDLCRCSDWIPCFAPLWNWKTPIHPSVPSVNITPHREAFPDSPKLSPYFLGAPRHQLLHWLGLGTVLLTTPPHTYNWSVPHGPVPCKPVCYVSPVPKTVPEVVGVIDTLFTVLLLRISTPLVSYLFCSWWTIRLFPLPWPGGLAGWRVDRTPKGYGFDSQSGHIPRLWI